MVSSLLWLFGPLLVQAESPLPPYAVVDLGNLGGNYSVATGINDLGQVVGYSSNGVAERAFLWLPRPAYGFGRGMNDLGALPGGWSAAFGINNDGKIAGTSRTGENDSDANPIEHLVLWEPDSLILQEIGKPPNTLGPIRVKAINDHGEIVGNAFYDFGVPGPTEWGFLWLPKPAYGLSAGFQLFTLVVEDLNNHGELVGWPKSDALGGERAYLWLPHPAYGLDSGLHVVPGLENIRSEAYGINDLGQVVGIRGSKPFLWETGSLTFLEDVGGHGSAREVNANDQVIGRVGIPSQPATWASQTVATLSSLIPVSPSVSIISAFDLNELGQIADRSRC